MYHLNLLIFKYDTTSNMIVNFINFNVTTGNMWLLFHNIITDTTFINTTFTLNPITLNNTVFYGRAV